ncbi:MAG TPA: class I SAM-dependent methyltransferase [Rhizomicrobium sp.]|nr:class I SAM-dependent methyltransferase [Rhizomicrobium sp.]
MTFEKILEFVEECYLAILHRRPREEEKNRWAKAVESGLTPVELLRRFRESPEFLRKNRIKIYAPPGHYYSPVVDPETVHAYHDRELAEDSESLLGVPLDVAQMAKLWSRWRETLARTNFSKLGGSGTRFYVDNGNFPFGDAAVLRATIAEARPRQIIEIGSGNSTACMLDALDEFDLITTHLTCIEPNPGRLMSLLRPGDKEKMHIFEQPVQDVSLEKFERLERGDILFIDSTHVLKTASDVHYELFHILPALQEGVLVHFHDCPYPFEYPKKWVTTDNKSWNEVYAVRAFLMYNKVFQVRFWMTLFAKQFRSEVENTLPLALAPPVGSGLWLSRTSENLRS